MSYMIEVYYALPADSGREQRITRLVERHEGVFDFREDDPNVCLTYEFAEVDAAEQAAKELRQLGEHVEGPCEYAS